MTFRLTERGRARVRATLRGVAGVAAFLLAWQLAVAFRVPLVAKVPTPVEVLGAFGSALAKPAYYGDWLSSFRRVFTGFAFAQLIGIPLGLLMGWRQRFHDLVFPVIEVLRPIPPLAWVPLAIVFWPTPESSIAFVIFLGAFFVAVINTISGVRAIDEDYVRAARSLGASSATIFRRIILPGALPSIFVGMSVGMGITWSVLVAAEIVAGKDGLGRFTWEAYVGGAFPTIIVGMISMGVAGFISSALTRVFAVRAMPWLRRA